MKSLLDLRGANGWILALAVISNLVWTFFALVIAFYFLDINNADAGLAQIGLLLAEIIGPFLIALYCGWIAFDDRGATYGLADALGSVF